MADVFISYKSEDRSAAKLFAEALMAEAVSVWWDPVLRTGETYDEVIERNLREAALVVVLWSPRSVKSKWVRAEATIGERKGGLLPVLIEACDRPIAFELVQTADLAGWTGDRDDARWADFMADLRAALSTRAAAAGAHTAPPPPDPLTIETLFWSSIKDGGDTADYESYLQRYPHGQFAELARARLARSTHEPVAARGALFDPGRYVFVSYPTDIAPALLLSVVRELLRRGLSIWLYDPSAYAFTPEEKARLRWQQAGGSWEQQTLDAIRNASAVIALVNGYSLQSRFQPREFKVAAQEKKLLPCIISDLDHKALPPVFRDMHAPKITAEMVDTDLGRNRIAMLASDAEARIARSRPAKTPPALSEGVPPRASQRRNLNWLWMLLALVGVIVVGGTWLFLSNTSERVEETAAEPARPSGTIWRDCAECPEVVSLPAGSFVRNGQPIDVDAFAMGRYELTAAEWNAFLASSGYAAQRASIAGDPAGGLNWPDAQAYVTWLSQHAGHRYRLPTWAEWEYAMRGKQTANANEPAFWWGETADPARANYAASGFNAPTQVGSYPANAFGLYDMAGNVWEWLEDCWDPDNTGVCSSRMLGGGSWANEADQLRSSAYGTNAEDERYGNFGMRVVREY